MYSRAFDPSKLTSPAWSVNHDRLKPSLMATPVECPWGLTELGSSLMEMKARETKSFSP